MDNLNYYYNIVENAIAKLGLDPQIARQKRAGHWIITKGQASVWIYIFYQESSKRIYFQVTSPVMKLPKQNKAKLALELLEINNILYGVAFCTNKEQVYIKTIREVEGLDSNEVLSMVTRTGNYCDQYQRELKGKYPEWVRAEFKNTPQNLN